MNKGFETPRVLILSADTGKGHNSAATAVKQIYDLNVCDCIIKDALLFVSPVFSRFVSWGHSFIYRYIPPLFNFMYGFTEKRDKSFKQSSLLYKLFARGADRLYDEITEGQFNTVICTHPFAAHILSEVQRRYAVNITTAFIATDYTCSPGVKEIKADMFFIPDKSLSDNFVCENIPPQKICPCGIPLRQEFYVKNLKSVAKRRFGIAHNKNHIVIMCGSMGCGPIQKLADGLSREFSKTAHITVVCGSNKRLYKKLSKKYSRHKGVKIFGFVENMSLLLDSADVYITKSGGISVSEAAVKAVPAVYIKAVKGCEEYNARFFEKQGLAKRADTPVEAVRLCKAVLSGGNDKIKKQSYTPFAVQNSAKAIYNALTQKMKAGDDGGDQTLCG